MTPLFEYSYDIQRSAWIVTFGRENEITTFMTEEEAKAYCDRENAEAKNQTIE